MYSIKKLMESPSAMSRFRAQTGNKISNTSTSSSFILISRIQKILKQEMTAERFDELKTRYFSKNTEVRREVFLDRLVSKVDMFDNETLRYILQVYGEKGFDETVDTLRLSQVKLRKLVNPLGNQKKVEEEEFDDDQFDMAVVQKITKS